MRCLTRLRSLAGLLFLCLIPFCAIVATCSPSLASPWASPGDVQFRHDLYLLQDLGHMHIPLSAWPVSMGDVAQALAGISSQDIQDPHAQAALQRVRRKVQKERRTGFSKPWARVSLLTEELPYRTFEDTPRGEGEAELGVEWLGKRFALRLQGQAVLNPDDDRELRPDGSLAGMILGNWMFSLGYQSRWWGPSPADSLILSSNARPFPALAVQRNKSDPFELPVLEYLGPWNLRAFAGKLENDREVPRPWIIGMRLDFSPTSKLEIGLSRTLLWGGKGVKEDLDELGEYLVTGDNEVVRNKEGVTRVDQMAGYDFRWRSPLYGDFPYALYGQFIGEDEAGNLPYKYIGLFGVEHWGSLELIPASYRVYAEFADTKAAFFSSSSSDSRFNTAYSHSRYKTGYRYRGRCLGHGLDNDSQVFTLGGSLIQEDATWSGFLRYGRINRDEKGKHTLAPDGEYLMSGQLSREFPALKGMVTLGLRLEHIESMQDDDTDTEAIGFISWSSRPR